MWNVDDSCAAPANHSKVWCKLLGPKRMNYIWCAVKIRRFLIVAVNGSYMQTEGAILHLKNNNLYHQLTISFERPMSSFLLILKKIKRKKKCLISSCHCYYTLACLYIYIYIRTHTYTFCLSCNSLNDTIQSHTHTALHCTVCTVHGTKILGRKWINCVSV